MVVGPLAVSCMPSLELLTVLLDIGALRDIHIQAALTKSTPHSLLFLISELIAEAQISHDNDGV